MRGHIKNSGKGKQLYAVIPLFLNAMRGMELLLFVFQRYEQGQGSYIICDS